MRQVLDLCTPGLGHPVGQEFAVALFRARASYPLLASRETGADSIVNSTTSSPVTVLMS